MKTTAYGVFPSHFGNFCLVWQEAKDGPRVLRILFPHEETPAEDLVNMYFPEAIKLSKAIIKELGNEIQSFCDGKEVKFDLDIISFEKCSEFQKRVLLAEYKIPRGWVSTYGRIAQFLGIHNGARAVGNALANNPFPIVIPCHRAIRSDGKLGGFQSGIKMKKALLEFEGIEFSKTGMVSTKRIYY
jgi:methylated-DNA-[protein]-cysteine S-methyltransferase